MFQASGQNGGIGRHTMSGRPNEVVDGGVGQAKLQLAGEAAAGGPGDRLSNPEFQRGEKQPQTTD